MSWAQRRLRSWFGEHPGRVAAPIGSLRDPAYDQQSATVFDAIRQRTDDPPPDADDKPRIGYWTDRGPQARATRVRARRAHARRALSSSGQHVPVAHKPIAQARDARPT